MYVPGSVLITATDRDGNATILRYGEDYSVSYDPDTDKIVVEIFRPSDAEYNMTFDTQIYIPEEHLNAQYSCQTTVELFGAEFKDSEDGSVDRIVVIHHAFRVFVQKLTADTLIPLENSLVGLYAQNGELIVTKYTNANGELYFINDIANGILLQEHVLYYVKEIVPPDGYVQDVKKHWLYFCEQGDECHECELISQRENGEDALRIPKDAIKTIISYNLRATALLPNTGSIGKQICYILGVILILTPCIYIIGKKRHRRKRGCKL